MMLSKQLIVFLLISLFISSPILILSLTSDNSFWNRKEKQETELETTLYRKLSTSDRQGFSVVITKITTENMRTWYHIPAVKAKVIDLLSTVLSFSYQDDWRTVKCNVVLWMELPFYTWCTQSGFSAWKIILLKKGDIIRLKVHWTEYLLNWKSA